MRTIATIISTSVFIAVFFQYVFMGATIERMSIMLISLVLTILTKEMR